MPMTQQQMEQAILLLQAESGRQKALISEQAVRIKTLENAPVSQLAEIVTLLQPVSTHAANILAVQAGSMGVRQ